jgi:RNA polymerase-binding protein DksA
MSHLTEDQLGELRAHLEAESDSLGEELAEHGKISGGDWKGASGAEKSTEADPNDAADQIEELVTNVPLVEELEKRLHDVKDALEKMDTGTYGTCDACHAEIPKKRLDANPAARTCIAHATAQT